MAAGYYNISASNKCDSELKEDTNDESKTKSKNQKRKFSNLYPAFFRSFSFNDRYRNSTSKYTHKGRYKPLTSSLEQIPSDLLPPSEGRSHRSSCHVPESAGIGSSAELDVQSSIYTASSPAAYRHINQDQLQEIENWAETRYHAQFGADSERLLKKVLKILRTLVEDISESLTDLTRLESIALESIVEIYKNKGKTTEGSFEASKFDASTGPSDQQRFDDCQSFHETSESFLPSAEQSPKNIFVQSIPQRSKNVECPSIQQIPKNSQFYSTPQVPKNFQSPSTPQIPKNLHSRQIPKSLQSSSIRQALKNLQFSSKTDSNNSRSAEPSLINVSSSTKANAQDTTSGAKPMIEFDLPTDHEQFLKITGALQNRCLEYREMIQDIAGIAWEACVNFTEPFLSLIQQLRKQFKSQKRNFRDFKVLCCKAVVFGPDSQAIDEKMTEVIQTFHLKLLQEENETFMARLEFGLEMAKAYGKVLELETEIKKTVTTLEKELFSLRLTSVGFKV